MNLPLALVASIHWKWQLGWAVKISLGLLSRIRCGTCISLIAYEVWHITKSSLTSERITITVLSISIPAGVFDQSDWWKDYKRPSYLDRRLEVSSSAPIRPPSLSPERVVFQRTLSSSSCSGWLCVQTFFHLIRFVKTIFGVLYSVKALRG